MNKTEEISELLSIVKKIADADLQKGNWFDQNPDLYISYFETVPHFVDLASFILKHWEDYPIDYPTIQKLKSLFDRVEDFDTKVYEKYEGQTDDFDKILSLILNDPEWDCIRNCSKELLEKIENIS